MSRRTRNRHSIGVKQESIVYECIDCNYRTRSETGIQLHRKKSHKIKEVSIVREKDLINQCKDCEKTFTGLKEIKKHVKLCHRQT